MTTYIVDIILIGLLALGAVRGFIKGLISQLFSLAALLLGIWGAIRFSDFTATLLVDKFNLSNEYMSLVSFALTFALIVVAVHFLGKLIEGLFDLTVLGVINKVLGAIFGAAKYAFILSVLIVLAEKVNVRANLYSREAMEKSYVYDPLSGLAPSIFPYLYFDTIKNSVKESLKINGKAQPN